jgi:hypothetical protein
MSTIESRAIIARPTIRGRVLEIERIDSHDRDQRTFTVRDAETGVLLGEPCPEQPDETRIKTVLDRLAVPLDQGDVEDLFDAQQQPLLLAVAVGRAFVVGAHRLTVRPSRRSWYGRGGWDLLEDGQCLNEADPFPHPPTPGEVDSFMSVRKRRLDHKMSQYSVTASCDYSHDDVYALLHSDHECPRYVAVTNDETYTFFTLHEHLPDALESLAAALGQDSGGQITGVIDLETEELLTVRSHTYCTIVNHAPQQAQPGPHAI